MPIHKGHDTSGKYYQWGDHGKKYYYGNIHGSEEEARKKAVTQMRAAFHNGYRGH